MPIVGSNFGVSRSELPPAPPLDRMKAITDLYLAHLRDGKEVFLIGEPTAIFEAFRARFQNVLLPTGHMVMNRPKSRGPNAVTAHLDGPLETVRVRFENWDQPDDGEWQREIALFFEHPSDSNEPLVQRLSFYGSSAGTQNFFGQLYIDRLDGELASLQGTIKSELDASDIRVAEFLGLLETYLPQTPD